LLDETLFSLSIRPARSLRRVDDYSTERLRSSLGQASPAAIAAESRHVYVAFPAVRTTARSADHVTQQIRRAS
jgi:hypothetical protein